MNIAFLKIWAFQYIFVVWLFCLWFWLKFLLDWWRRSFFSPHGNLIFYNSFIFLMLRRNHARSFLSRILIWIRIELFWYFLLKFLFYCNIICLRSLLSFRLRNIIMPGFDHLYIDIIFSVSINSALNNLIHSPSYRNRILRSKGMSNFHNKGMHLRFDIQR